MGAAIAVGGTRNGGQEGALNAILGFYHTQGMVVCNGERELTQEPVSGIRGMGQGKWTTRKD